MEHYDIKTLMDFFEPLTQEEQKLLLFMCIDTIEELKEKAERAEENKNISKTQKVIYAIQMETYMMFVQILSHSPMLEDMGLGQVKDHMFKSIREKYRKLYDEDEIDGEIKC